LLVVAACALFATRLQAQSNQDPDFSNVNDILHGNRTLLQLADYQVVNLAAYPFLSAYQGTSSNSSLASPQQIVNNHDGNDVYFMNYGGTIKSFSGWMFDQPQAITLIAASPSASESYPNLVGAQLLIPNNSLLAPNNSNLPWAYVKPRPGSRSAITGGAMADFNLDGYDDLVFSYDDGTIQVATAANVNKPAAFIKLGPSAQLDPLIDLAAGDFNGDGQPEIAGLSILSDGGLKLVVYNVDPNTLAITPASSLVLTTLGANSASPITHVSIARGKFNTLAHDQLAVAFATDAGSSTVEIIDFAAKSLTPAEASLLVVSNVGISGGFIEVKTGQFAFPNPYDQIVFHSSSPAVSGGKFFKIISVDPTSLALTANAPATYDGVPCSGGIAVGNFDHQQPDPMNPGKNKHDPNAQIAFSYGNCDNTSYFTINVWNVDPTTFSLTLASSNATNIVSGGGIYQAARSFIATDLQGRSAVLGTPTKVTIDNTRPTVITAAPPMHIDYITPIGASKPEVLNLSYIPDGFNTSYQLTQQSKSGGSTTHKMSWSAGVDESLSGAYQIGDPDQGIGGRIGLAFHAAQDFTGSTEENGSNFSSTEFDVSAATRTADSVFYEGSTLNIWVYPVLGQKACPALPNNAPNNCPPDQQLPLTVQFSGPDSIVSGNISDDVNGAPWYQPPWEFGNIFSYPATKEQLALIYPDLAKTQLSSDLTFHTDNASKKIQTNWSSGSEQGSTTAFSDNFSFGLEETFVASVGLGDISTAKVSQSLKVSGSFGFENLQTNTASMQASNGIGIQAVGIFRDPPNYAYAVTPVILGNSPPTGIGDSTQPPAADIQTIGPLKTAFVADPLAAGAWWHCPNTSVCTPSPYQTTPDVALNHPYRWILTAPALSNPIPDNCANTGTGASQMNCADIAPYMPNDAWDCDSCWIRGFFITSADKPGAGPQLGFATAGDQLDLGVRVYNYSFAPMPEGTTVHVRFYAIAWDTATSTSVGDSLSAGNSFLIGETVLDPIPPFSDSSGAPLNWVIAHAPTPFDTTPYKRKSLVFWVVVWMQDANGNLVKEIEGHGLKSVPGTLTSLADVPVDMATDTQDNPASYSNNAGLYHYEFKVLPPPNELVALPPSNLAEITLDRVSASKEHIRPGEVDMITALLKAGPAGATGLKVHFYDGDPGSGGRLIALETASVQGNSTMQVRIPYHVPTDGVHRIWAQVNKGKPYQTEGHTETISVKWPTN
jgi:hypothetical protein